MVQKSIGNALLRGIGALCDIDIDEDVLALAELVRVAFRMRKAAVAFGKRRGRGGARGQTLETQTTLWVPKSKYCRKNSRDIRIRMSRPICCSARSSGAQLRSEESWR